MRPADLLGLTREAIGSHRLRYGLTALAIAVGVAAVVLLAAIGEGTRRFIERQMTQFGTTLIAINPGKLETGGIPGTMASRRKLTVEDARALRRIPAVTGVVPTAYGSARVSAGGRGRDVYLYGVSAEAEEVWLWRVAVGRFIPEMDYDRGSAVVVLGTKLKRELFGDANPLGAAVRIGDSRFRVIGVMESKGNYLGFDLDDAAFIPVANAMRLLNRPELDEIDLAAATVDDIDPVAARARAMLMERHDGEEDFTITTQKEAQGTVNRILGVVTAVVTAIAGISLLVGAIGILTIMWIVVQERVGEIGLIKALGARREQILTWYLFEAAVTAVAGGIAGLTVGLSIGGLLAAVVPGISVSIEPWMILAAVGMALAVGLLAGVAPARRAARMSPVDALRDE
jgi:putative ABC transport system permease protein